MRLWSVILLSLAASRYAQAGVSFNCFSTGQCKPGSLSGASGALPDLSLPLPPEFSNSGKPVVPAKVVYRGDPRGPEEIKAYISNGEPRPGFYPRQGPEISQKYSLYSHVQGNIGNTAYVSTTTDLQKAAWYSLDGNSNGFIYKIEASPTFIDVNKSLRMPKYFGNIEYSAMEGIPWSKVIGYVKVTDEISELFQLNNLDKIVFTPNEDFVASPEHLQGASVRPELAGFPDDHKAWESEPWKTIKTKFKGVPDIKATFKGIKDSPKDFDIYSLHYEDESVDFVYATNSRTPTELQQANGIYPRGYKPGDSFAGDRSSASSNVNLDQLMGEEENKAFVKLYKKFGEAGKAVMDATGPEKMRIWKVKTTRNMFPHRAIEIEQKDTMLALGGVHWRQIVGHYELDPVQEREDGRFMDSLIEPDTGKDRFYANDEYQEDLFGKEKHVQASDIDSERKAQLKELLNLPHCTTSSASRKRDLASCVWTDTDLQDGIGQPSSANEKPDENSSFLPSPETEDLQPFSPQEIELAAAADVVSEAEFALFAAKTGLAEVPKQKWGFSISDVRAKLLGYRPLESELSKFRAWNLVPKVGSATLVGIGFGLWAKELVDTFTHDVGALDRAAVMTVLVPFVGCASSGIAAAAHGTSNLVDTSLCVLGDTLLLSGPAAPLGVLIHAIRYIISLFEYPAWPTKDVLREVRDENWQKFLNDHVYQYLYDKSFGSLLNSTLVVEGLAVGSDGAQTIGALNATAQTAYETAGSDEERAEIEIKTLESTTEIREAMETEYIRRQRAALLQLPRSFVSDQKSLQETAAQYNKEYIKHLETEEVLNHYAPGTEHGDAFGLTGNEDIRNQLQSDLATIQAHLRETPLPMPELYHVAFVMGQSRSLKVDRDVLSPGAYMDAAGRRGRWIDIHVVRQARAISQLLQGSITPDRLPDIWNIEDVETVREFQVLLAMRFGRAVEDTKRRWADRYFSEAAGTFLSDRTKRYLESPSLPPAHQNIGSFAAIGLIVEMTDVAAEALLHEVDRGELDRDDDIMQYARWLQATLHDRDWFSIILQAEDTVSQRERKSQTSED